MYGYLHRDYCASFAGIGTATELSRAGGWVLRREIPPTTLHDAMGAYPIFCCRDWSALPRDLEEQRGELVALSLVTDPFGNHTPGLLHQAFPDRVIPFKEHFVMDLKQGLDSVSCHHRRNVRKALARVEVEISDAGASHLDQWVHLYDVLTRRYGIRGIPAFSRKAFEAQLRIPGISVFRGVCEGRTVGMLLWYRQDEVCYYHLGAYDESGYQMGASFALFFVAIEFFREQGLRWLELGAGAGLVASDADGLTRFKRGWTRQTRTAYLCGRIFDHRLYHELSRGKGSTAPYFPAYRSGDFNGVTSLPL